MTKPVDLELKKAFMDLQGKMVESSKRIQVIDGQLAVLKRVLQHAGITKRELGMLSPRTKTYESVGRMFLLTDLNDIKNNLKKRTMVLLGRNAELERNKQYLEKNLKESQDNLREMVQIRKEQGDIKPT